MGVSPEIPWFGEWELCRTLDCREPSSARRLDAPGPARQWLRRLQSDVRRMLAMRSLLWLEGRAPDVSRMSDDDVLDLVAELLVSGRFHIHVRPVHKISRQGRSTAGSAEKPGTAPAFPLSERKQRPARSAVSTQSMVLEPPTFLPGADPAAQAAALTSAADTGKAVCCM